MIATTTPRVTVLNLIPRLSHAKGKLTDMAGLHTNTTAVVVDKLVTDHALVASPQKTSEYVRAYVDLVRTYDFVEGVYVDISGSLTIYTVYHGERRAISDKLYEAYGQIIDQFPDMPVDFRLLKQSRLDAVPVPSTAHKVFPS